MALLFVVSAQPHLRLSDDGGLDFVVRKLGHAGAYAILAALLLRAIGSPDARAVVGAVILAVTYAVGDELHQGFVAGRFPSAFDVAIDAAGALGGALLSVRLAPRVRIAAGRRRGR
jgi:VanZ family protein